MYSINKIPRIIIKNNILISKRFNINEILRIKEYIKEIDENKGDEQTLKYLKKYKYNDITYNQMINYKKNILPDYKDITIRIKEYIKEIDENKGDEQTLKYLKKYKYNDIQIIDILKYKESLKSNKNIE
jgi:hypothetical protein